MRKKSYLIFAGIFLVVLISFSFISGYMRSDPQYTQYYEGGYYGSFSDYDYSKRCEAGQDFIVQIAPFGCTPAIVRSDLLEEQNVPVFCELMATKLNPMIEVEEINTISFSGQYPPEISGIGFHPAQSALGTENKLNSPIAENIGYAVIVLRQQEIEDDMPDFIRANLTADIRYDIKDAFGVGQSVFYVPELSDENWGEQKNYYNFWNHRGFLKAESVYDEEASIAVYDAEGDKYTSVRLEKGESSHKLTLPGMDCLARFQIKLNDIVAPDTRAIINVNSEVYFVGEGEKFLDNRCTLREIDKKGLWQKISVNCREDEESNNFDLTLSPRVNLTIGNSQKIAAIGDKVGTVNDEGIYLVYIGSVDRNTKSVFNTGYKEDLIAYFYKTSRNEGEKLSNSLIESAVRKIDSKLSQTDLREDVSPKISSSYSGVSYGLQEEIFELKINLTGFAGANDLSFSNEELKKYFENASADFEQVIKQFPGEKESGALESDKTFAEESMREYLELVKQTKQFKKLQDLCKEFEERYPELKLVFDSYCLDDYEASNLESSDAGVLIDGKIKMISLKEISQPSVKDYGVQLSIRRTSGENNLPESITLGKNQFYYLSDDEYIQLVSVERDKIKLRLHLIDPDEENGGFIKNDKGVFDLTKEQLESFGSRYSFRIEKINLNEVAKVSIVPTIDNSGTEANFSFQIGIEKRGIRLSPEKTKEKIAELEKTIADWTDKSEKLGEVVEGLKATCLGTGAFLTLKNFVNNLDGKSIARNKVMTSPGGWNERCAEAVRTHQLEYSDGTKKPVDYSSVEECFNEESGKIDAEVNKYTEVLQEHNSKSEILASDCNIESSLSFGGETINDNCFMDNYVPYANDEVSGRISGIQCSDDLTISSEGFEKIINKENWKTKGIYSLSQLQDLDFYSRAYVKNNNDIMAKNQICEIYDDMHTNSREFLKAKEISNDLGGISPLIAPTKEKSVEVPYSNEVRWNQIKNSFTQEFIDGSSDLLDDTPVQVFQDSSSGKIYLFVLNENNVIIKTYEIKREDTGKYSLVKESEGNPLNVVVQKRDASAYKNPYKASIGESRPILTYYETEPYKGRPAIVPFDLNNGWYARITQSLPVAGNMRSYDDSGRVSSLYICNVMENGIEENGKGDDSCTMVNLGTGQPYNQIAGLDERDAKKIIDCAVDAVEQASRAYPASGKVPIRTSCGGDIRADIGKPAVDVPDIQCTNFMSPTDCKWLFNVCDPVICPSSRCDLGGAYPVSDVVQSGIIGSIVLCLPNFREGIYIPVCLTGIKAGIDGLLSVYESYRDCLQESLDTGKMVGVCDEIYSIHLCDFFWRQALPAAKMVIPKMIEIALGQSTRGGGEYMAVQDAWDTAGQSLDYFVNYYSVESAQAFKSRIVEGVGQEVCKGFVSVSYPDEANLLDSLVNPDSPPQFHGRFDEIPFTTATNPPTSQYKVYYHIYAGKEARAYYRVYLKGNSESSYYRDTASDRVVAFGYIPEGEYASETKDFTAPSGYRELCINVNGQEECGFKEVSTSFALNYVNDEYMKQQALEQDIKTEAECVSGTISAYSLVNPNLQSAAQSIVDPAIYQQGIIRICANENPGKNSDNAYNSESQRWVEVGNCDNGQGDLKCWIDRESVNNAVEYFATENETLKGLSEAALKKLSQEGDYFSPEKSEDEIKKIKKDVDFPEEQISMINKIYDKVFWNKYKAHLLYLRGMAYAELAKDLFNDLLDKESQGRSVDAISEQGAGKFPGGPEEQEGDEGSVSGELNSVCKSFNCGTMSMASGGGLQEVMAGNSCIEIVGKRIIGLASEKKIEYGIDDSKIKADTNGQVECFEELILMQARQEGCLSHCRYKQGETNPLYCEEGKDENEVIKGDNGNSIGIMQIYYSQHKTVMESKNLNVYDFEDNVNYGIDYLISRYNYCKNNQNQDNWLAALNSYNGRGCVTDGLYSQEVLKKKEDYDVSILFTDICNYD
ncbi:transglycosylase SLT domain-containing protein [Candidatus Pacearchaeota archaeon]|nr:transglycosylase SLT domain-containing protein [Candidatus Pacearchaeota archaeon]